MKIMNIQCSVVIVGICIAAGQGQVRAQSGYTDMPYKFKSSSTGTVISDSRRFYNTAYFPDSGAYCLENHRDPDGNKYEHSHLPDGFPFTYPPTGEQVTVAKANDGWDPDFVGYNHVGDATFSKNCFAHAAETPTVTFYPGWSQFTTECDKCEDGAKSIGDRDHVRKFTHWFPYENSECIVDFTSEKMASSRVYEHGWGPLGRDVIGEKRKKK